MYKKILLSLVFGFFFCNSFSQCTETPETKVLLVGDSWAWFMNTDRTFDNVLKTWGHSNATFFCNATLAVNGADTKDFVKASAEAEICNQLAAHPSIKAVHLSIGGNDFLGDWNVSMTQAQTDTLTDAVFVRLDSIIRVIKNCKPDVKILWSGYCYTNFKEIISGPGGLGSIHPFYNTWHGMGEPDFNQINTLQNSISVKIDAYCATHPDVYYYNANGLMQYVYGQSPALTVPPGGTYPAYSVAMPLGDPTYPSPKISMRDYGITKDCYHLSAEGYRYLIGYHTKKFYQKLLMDDLYLLSENNTQTGTVSSAGNISDSLVLGESGGESFSPVLSFNTTGMANTTLDKASIFLRRKSLTGTNPISGSLMIKVKNGNFGTSANVESADYTAADDANGTPCLFGSNTANGDWIRLDLPASILPYIKNAASTQFILSAPGATGGTVVFNNSNDPDFAPVLNLDYFGSTAIGTELEQNHFTLYPNPTDKFLNIKNDGEVIQKIELVDLVGRVILKPLTPANTIDISSLPVGMYVLNITTAKGKSSQRVVKQ